MNYKKYLSLLVTASMGLSFGACTNNSNDATTATTVETISETIDYEYTLMMSGRASNRIPKNAVPEVYREIIGEMNELIDSSFQDDFNFMEYSEFDFNDKVGGYGLYVVLSKATTLGQDEVYDHISFALVDIDNNGVDELIIASRILEGDSYFYSIYGEAGYEILCIYTLDGDEVNTLALTGVRNHWFVSSEGRLISRHGDNRFCDTVVYELNSDGTGLEEIYGQHSGYIDGYDNPMVYEQYPDGSCIVIEEYTEDLAVVNEFLESNALPAMNLTLISINSEFED